MIVGRLLSVTDISRNLVGIDIVAAVIRRRVAVPEVDVNAWRVSAWRCITSCATPSADHSTCPHAATHTAVLPHAAGYNAGAEPAAMQQIAHALGAESAPLGLFQLGCAVDAKMALRDLGLRESELDRAADLAVQNPYWNPRPIEREAIRNMLQRAWAGNPPQ